MVINGFTLEGDWKNSSSGQIARATRSGSKYFLKKYQTPVEPINNGSLDPKTLKANQDRFNKFVSIRSRVNKVIRSIAGSGGNIIIPTTEFTYDNHYVEASEYIEGAVKDDDLEALIKSLPFDTKKLLLLTGTGALMSIHKLGIVHSDLKLKNILVVKSATGYSAKLIDFDNAYFPDELPDEVVGDINYYSPELGTFSDLEDDDERAEYGKNLTTKSDIFSLGLIFHYYLTGEPVGFANLNDRLKKRQAAGKSIYPWTVLINDGTLVISDKVTSPNLRNLLTDMLQKDYSKRPDAQQVLIRLKAKDEAPAPSPVRPEPKKEEAKPVPPTIKKEPGYCAPWPEHDITLNTEKLAARRFVLVEQATLSGQKGYNLYSNLEGGAPMFFTMEKLCALGYARKGAAPIPTPVRPEPKKEEVKTEPKKEEAKPVEAGICEPYPEDNIIFDEEVLKAKGIVRVEQATLNGTKGYNFINNAGGTRFILAPMAVVLKFAKRK